MKVTIKNLGPVWTAGREVCDYSLDGKLQKQQSSQTRQYIVDWCKPKNMSAL